MTVSRVLIFLWVSMFLAAAPVGADEVHLRNGDRVTGTVVRMSEEKLVVQTAYAGEIEIDWNEVAGLDSTAPIRVVLSDGTRLEGSIVDSGEGIVRIASDALQAPVEFSLSEVRELNPEEVPPVRIAARANVGISVEDGNTDLQSYRIDGEFTARTEKSRYRVGGEWNYEKSEGVDTVKNWLGYAGYRYFFAPKWFVFVNTLFESNRFADLNLRTTAGGGGGYQFFESPELNLSVELGGTYVDENFDLAPDNSYGAVQWGVDYNQFIFDNIQLFHRDFGYWSLVDSEDWLIKTRQGIRRPIFKGFTATLQFNYDYDNSPSPGARTEWDWKLLFLLGYYFEE